MLAPLHRLLNNLARRAASRCVSRSSANASIFCCGWEASLSSRFATYLRVWLSLFRCTVCSYGILRLRSGTLNTLSAAFANPSSAHTCKRAMVEREYSAAMYHPCQIPAHHVFILHFCRTRREPLERRMSSWQTEFISVSAPYVHHTGFLYKQLHGIARFTWKTLGILPAWAGSVLHTCTAAVTQRVARCCHMYFVQHMGRIAALSQWALCLGMSGYFKKSRVK